MNKNFIGKNIRIFRERRNLTQQELASKIGKTWEMISRYERGATSALTQLTNLADALKVEPSDLLKDYGESEKNPNITNRIPLFVKIPTDFDFVEKTTYIFYACPDWVIKLDDKSFVIDTNIVSMSYIEEISNTGYLFVSPNSIPKFNDPVLVRNKNILEVKRYRKDFEKIKIGKIVAQELRF